MTSTCAPIGGGCTEQFCLPEDEQDEGDDEDNGDEDGEQEGEQCGPNVCSEGTYCCSESCGYCVAPGEGCTKEFCS